MVDIVFVIPGNIKEGRGGEKVLFSYIKYKPEIFNVTIIQNNLIENKRLDDEFINTNLKNTEIYTYDASGNQNVYRKLFGNYTIKDLIKDLFISIFKNPYKKDFKNILKNYPNIYNKIINADIAYLFSNNHAILFRKSKAKIIIGSNHLFNINELEYTSFKKLYVNLHDRYFYKYTNGFHFFPQNYKYKNILNKKYNISLGVGINTSLFYPNENKQNNKIKFFFLASLRFEKGLDILLPVIDYFKDNSDIEFHIAGSGPLENEIVKRDYIKFYKNPDDNKLSELYRNMDIFIYPSHNDAYPSVVLQALSSGLYVLCSDYLKGIFDDFENEYLKYIKNTKEYYVNEIKKIIEDRNIIIHDKNSEHKKISENYDEKIITEKLYDNLLKFIEN